MSATAWVEGKTPYFLLLRSGSWVKKGADGAGVVGSDDVSHSCRRHIHSTKGMKIYPSHSRYVWLEQMAEKFRGGNAAAGIEKKA